MYLCLSIIDRGQHLAVHFCTDVFIYMQYLGPSPALLSLERVKIDTNSLGCRWTMASTDQLKINCPLTGLGQETHFLSASLYVSKRGAY